MDKQTLLVILTPEHYLKLSKIDMVYVNMVRDNIQYERAINKYVGEISKETFYAALRQLMGCCGRNHELTTRFLDLAMIQDKEFTVPNEKLL